MSESALVRQRADVIAPRTEDEFIEFIRDANVNGAPVRLSGAGNWLDAGRPVHASSILSTAKLSGIVEYVPGDLVLTARAGTSLAELASATAGHGQWFALDPFGHASGTLGATIASASSGPLSTGFGRARDLVLGITAITGDGQRIRFGGRVVKNVAGFDLVRLLTGSWGTLAAITEVSVRLHALPQWEESVVVQLSDSSLDAQLAALRAMPLSTMALQLVNSTTASTLTNQTHSPVLLARLGGNAARVDAQRALLANIGRCDSVDGGIWTRFRELELHRKQTLAPFVMRVSHGASKTAALFTALMHIASRDDSNVFVAVSPLDGIARVIGFDPAAASSFIEAAHSFGARVIGERLMLSDWQRLPSPMNRIAEGIRDRFDPARILNRGMFDNASSSPALP